MLCKLSTSSPNPNESSLFQNVTVIVRGTPHTLPWLGLIGMGESLRGGACTVSMIEIIKV
jgi:hypothetical protein